MMDKLGRDQYVLRMGDNTVVFWNDGKRSRTEQVGAHACTVGSPAGLLCSRVFVFALPCSARRQALAHGAGAAVYGVQPGCVEVILCSRCRFVVAHGGKRSRTEQVRRRMHGTPNQSPWKWNNEICRAV